jgi:cell division protein FtsL
MLQAESSLARDWKAPVLPERPPLKKVTHRTVYKINNKRKLYFKTAVILFGYALLLVFLCIKSATLGYQIENLQNEISDLETANNRIEYQIAEKSALSRVEQIAAAQLGMVKPDEKSVLAMEVVSEPIQVASATTGLPNQNVSEKIWHNMFNSLARLAQNNN